MEEQTMHKRSSIVVGTILILVGILFLLVQFFPGLAASLDISTQWPLIIVGVGGLLILSAFLGTPKLAIPGSIVTGIGGILYVQNLTGAWDSWAYVWALIPWLCRHRAGAGRAAWPQPPRLLA
jgi:hypothetical protein